MRTETIERFLAGLAARSPVPGGGPSAALHAAQGAALLGMAARCSAGGRSGVLDDVVVAARARCDELCELALDLAAADAAASAAVTDAQRLPQSDEAQHRRRSASLGAARLGTGRVQAQVIAVTDEALGRAEALRAVAARDVLPEVAAAAESLRAAAGTARIGVEVVLVGITQAAAREELLGAIDVVDDLILRAAKVTATVREQILR